MFWDNNKEKCLVEKEAKRTKRINSRKKIELPLENQKALREIHNSAIP